MITLIPSFVPSAAAFPALCVIVYIAFGYQASNEIPDAEDFTPLMYASAVMSLLAALLGISGR